MAAAKAESISRHRDHRHIRREGRLLLLLDAEVPAIHARQHPDRARSDLGAFPARQRLERNGVASMVAGHVMAAAFQARRPSTRIVFKSLVDENLRSA